MATKLTIWIEDYPAGGEEDPLASAVSNLEYDGFDVLNWEIDFDLPYTHEEE